MVPGELRVMLPAASDPCGRPDMPYIAQQRLKTSIQMLGRTFVDSLVEADVMCTYPVRAISVHSPQVCVCVCVCVCVYTVYTVFERGLMYLTTLLNAGAHVLISIMLTQTSTNQH